MSVGDWLGGSAWAMACGSAGSEGDVLSSRAGRPTKRRGKWLTPLLLATAADISFVALAHAQTSPAAPAAASPAAEQSVSLGEIVVTAQRRSENLQKVPISVTAVQAGDLARANVASVADLKVLAPSLNFAEEGAWSQPHLRGIGTTATGPGIESAVAVYVDGVYHAAMVGGAADFNNISDVEVINGPQGTLFGRNATGGLIQIRTKDPSHTFGGNASIGYGNYNTTTASAYVTGGITDNLAADFALDFSNQGKGFGRNLFTGSEVDKTQNLFLRSKWAYTPTDDLKFTLALDYGDVRFSPTLAPAPGTTPIGGTFANLRPHDVDGFYDPEGRIKEGGVALTTDLDLHWAKFLSITAYRVTDSVTVEDGSLTPDPNFAENISLTEPHKQFSQEFQLASHPGGPLTWTAGLYYFHENAQYDPTHLYGGLYAPVSDIYYFTVSKTDSVAAYAQATYELKPDTRLTAGIRYTTETRSVSIVNPVVGFGGVDFGTTTDSGSRKFSAPSWRLALDHNFTPDVLGYISYNRGFKSGGWNPAQLPVSSFAPEKLDAYEVGLKTQSFEHRLRANISGFFYDYSNIQVQSFANGILDVSNGAEAHLYGLDFDSDLAVTRNFSLHAGLDWLHAEFVSYPNADFTTPMPGGGTAYSFFNAKGQQVPLAPKLTATVAANYTIPTDVGDFKLNATYNYNSGWYGETDERLRQSSYSVLNSQIAWLMQDGRYEIDFWGKNLTNSNYAYSLFSQFQGDVIQWAPPRTYGVTVRTKF